MERTSGVLLNISSLPGEFGIGGFSADAFNFIETIAKMGFHWWQILPVTTIGQGNSPYSGVSAFAGNFLYLDARHFESGLLTDEDINNAKYKGSIYLTDYPFVYNSKRTLLEKAFTRLNDNIKNSIAAFRRENSYWLEDYALYMALKENNNGAPWYKWEEGLKYREEKALAEAKERLEARISFYCFEQYEFFRQWDIVKSCAREYGVGIFGDMPIYVCYDSVDVWASPSLFQLDENLEMIKVSGVPPDYFAKEGQLWGNPLYDYKYMKKDNYKWFIARIRHNLKLYDMLRIDHFRGLYKYWAVPKNAVTACEGSWEKGPQMALWNALKKELPDANIIAEDLGLIDEGVREYLKKSGFYGMRVMQFGFDGDINNPHLPHNYIKKCVAYTSTHDNDTTLGWLLNLDNNTRDNAIDYVDCESSGGWASGGGYCRATKAFIRCIISSSSDLAIIPMQDLCGFGGDTRMNIPGIAFGNWQYRTNYTAMEGIDEKFMTHINNIYGRNNPFQIC